MQVRSHSRPPRRALEENERSTGKREAQQNASSSKTPCLTQQFVPKGAGRHQKWDGKIILPPTSRWPFTQGAALQAHVCSWGDARYSWEGYQIKSTGRNV